MAWLESTSGLYQRPLGAQETPSISPSAASQGVTREPIRIHAFADLSSSRPFADVLQAFKQAWTALRLLTSPEIAATYHDGQKLYKVATVEELEAWQQRTFLVAAAGNSVESVVQEMQGRLEPLPVFYLIPDSNEAGDTFKGSILFLVSHWMTEASGAFMIVNQLCDYASDLLSESSTTRSALSQYTLGSEVKLLTPPLEDMFVPYQHSSIESKQRIQAYFEHFTRHTPSLDFPTKQHLQPNTKPSHMMQNQRTYTPSSTSALVTACKSKGLSVASAIHSAYLSAIWQLATNTDRQLRPYACIMPAQMRTRLPNESPFRRQGCWNAARLLFLTAPAEQDFSTCAQNLRRQYGLADDKTWQYNDMKEMNDQTLNYFIKTPNQSSSQPFITSMGLLDGNIIVSQHGDITVDKVSVWADSLGLGIILGQWTFRGRLNLQVSWNIAFHDEDQVQSTLQLIDNILNVELGLDLQVEEVRKRTF